MDIINGQYSEADSSLSFIDKVILDSIDNDNYSACMHSALLIKDWRVPTMTDLNTNIQNTFQEYDIPQVRDAVHALLQEEMNSFAPSSSYLKHLPYPNLKFTNSPMLQVKKNLTDKKKKSSSLLFLTLDIRCCNITWRQRKKAYIINCHAHFRPSTRVLETALHLQWINWIRKGMLSMHLSQQWRGTSRYDLQMFANI